MKHACDPSDPRVQAVHPTAKAWRVYSVGRGELERIESEWLAILGAPRLPDLEHSLVQLAEQTSEAVSSL
jgi:hypothetical protein